RIVVIVSKLLNMAEFVSKCRHAIVFPLNRSTGAWIGLRPYAFRCIPGSPWHITGISCIVHSFKWRAKIVRHGILIQEFHLTEFLPYSRFVIPGMDNELKVIIFIRSL